MEVEARHSTGDKWTETREIRKVIEHLYFEVDYEYMTDFFLVYRLFIKPGTLLNTLCLQMKTAAMEGEKGHTICIRVFVSIRHCIMNYFADDFLSSASLRASFLRHMTHLKSAADGSKLYLLCSHLEHAWKIVSNIYIVSTPVIFEMNFKLKNTSNRFEVSMLKRDKPPNNQQYYKIYNSKYQNINQYNNIIEYSCQYKHNKDSISEKSSSLGLCNSCIENLKTISETKPDEMVSSATFDCLSGGYIYNTTTNKEKPSREWLNFYSKLDQKSNFSFSIPHKHASSYPRRSYTNTNII